MTQWTSRIEAPLGSQRERGVRATVSGPVSGRGRGRSSPFGTRARDGFTVNDVTGHTLDNRSAIFGRAQVLWMPTPRWETRFIVGGERDRDGDYALNDLGGRCARNPFHAQRDVEGYTNRDIWSSTVLVRHEGPRYAFSSATGGVWWKTRDFTDLDYSAQPLMTRDNAEKDRQFTQEFRLASAAQAPARLSEPARRWSGRPALVLFAQHYTQDAVNGFAPLVLSPYLGFPVNQHSPEAILDDTGLGAYGLGTLTAGSKLDLTVGARVDREQKTADLGTFYDPAIAPPTHVDADRTFSNVSPQAAVAWRPSIGMHGLRLDGHGASRPAASTRRRRGKRVLRRGARVERRRRA